MNKFIFSALAASMVAAGKTPSFNDDAYIAMSRQEKQD